MPLSIRVLYLKLYKHVCIYYYARSLTHGTRARFLVFFLWTHSPAQARWATEKENNALCECVCMCLEERERKREWRHDKGVKTRERHTHIESTWFSSLNKIHTYIFTTESKREGEIMEANIYMLIYNGCVDTNVGMWNKSELFFCETLQKTYLWTHIVYIRLFFRENALKKNSGKMSELTDVMMERKEWRVCAYLEVLFYYVLHAKYILRMWT